ncbi:MAG: hypothetical protein Q7R62_00540 [bacterium]|nr:hypothetical protein [bacterium]
MKTLLIIILVAAVIGLGVYAFTRPATDDTPDNNTDTTNDGTVTSVRVPVFAEGGDVVCGMKIVYIERSVAPTKAPLNAAYRALFEMSEPYVVDAVQYQNPIGYQTSKTEFTPLKFVRADLANGVASVYLEGSITGVGTCYDPLPKIQLDTLAKQFPTVTSVKYYLNGKETDPGCIADQSGLKPCYTGTE